MVRHYPLPLKLLMWCVENVRGESLWGGYSNAMATLPSSSTAPSYSFPTTPENMHSRYVPSPCNVRMLETRTETFSQARVAVLFGAEITICPQNVSVHDGETAVCAKNDVCHRFCLLCMYFFSLRLARRSSFASCTI